MKSFSTYTTLALLLICGNFAANGAETKVNPDVELAKICERALCRTPKVSLYIDGEHRFEHEDKAPFPILQNRFMVIFPGENLFVEAVFEDGHIKLDRAVSSNQLPDRTIEFAFTQMPGKPDMMLQIKNPLPVIVKFHMGFMRPDSDAVYNTSSCPVLAGRSLFEHWPHPIYQLILADVEVLGPSDDMTCK